MPTDQTTDTDYRRWKSEALTDPVLFAKRVLGDDPWETQIDIIRAVEQPRSRVAAKGCHGSSKTYLSAELTLWFISRFTDGIVITTAPTDRQVEKIMWGEIHKAAARSRIAFRPQKGSDYPALNLMELKVGPNNFAIGFSTSKSDHGVRFQGFHGGHMLFILDEAPGIAPEVLDAIAGAAAGGDVRILMLGNPTIPGGPFYEAFTSNRKGWKTFTIDAYDTPNFAELRKLVSNKEEITGLLRTLPEDHPAMQYAPRPYLVTPIWAKEHLIEWTEQSPRWESRARGAFPLQAENALISLKWIEAATIRWQETEQKNAE